MTWVSRAAGEKGTACAIGAGRIGGVLSLVWIKQAGDNGKNRRFID